MAAQRYICIQDNQYDGKKVYVENGFYELPGSPPASFFTATTLDLERPRNLVGFTDMDNTYYYGKGVRGFDDLTQQFIGRKVDEISGRITYDYTECTVDFATNARYPEEPICFTYQMSHGKKRLTPLFPHVHWFQEEDNIPNFLIAYRWYNNGAEVPTFTFAAYIDSVFTYDSETSLLQITRFPVLSAPSDEGISSFLDIIFFRDTANGSTLFAGADPYTIASKMKLFDLHASTDSLGSGRQYQK